MTIALNEIPLTLYIHLPWCVRKCPYCDFNSHQASELPEKEYLAALMRDFSEDLAKIAQRKLQAIFIGGGTPSLFSGESIAKLLEGVHSIWPFSHDIEITLEANPGTVEQQRFKEYRKAGVNRLSLGIQSFQDEKLKLLGRIHNTQEALRAIHSIKAAGFDNFNLDLMFGLPQQNLLEALSDLRIAIENQPTHLSWYKLTLEPNTYFHHHPPPLPKDDLIWQMHDEGQEYLSSQGYAQYEISAYSQPGYECDHNRNYWEFGDYLGIGAGAHSKITMQNGEVLRFWKTKHPKIYLQTKQFIAEQKIITREQLPFEFMLNHLRLNTPVPLQLFEKRTGLKKSCILNVLEKAQHKGFLAWDNDFITLSSLGKNFTNELLELFL